MAPSAAGARGLRLTLRGYVVVFAMVVGGIAASSAATLAASESAPEVAQTQVVARAGESVEEVAQRAAQGRDVAEVADAIRAANGLAVSQMPQAGDILVVPGS